MRLLHPAGTTGAQDPDLDAVYAHPPGLRLGFVASLDGSTAVGGSSLPLSGPADKQAFRALRRAADVVLVGAGTARAEGYRPVRLAPEVQEQRAARGQAPVPGVAVVTRGRGLPPGSALDGAAGTRVLTCPDDASLVAALAALRDEGLVRVLCEGGARLAGALLRLDLVDEVCATVAPVLAGGDGPRLTAGADERVRALQLVSLLEEDGVLLGRWVLRRL